MLRANMPAGQLSVTVPADKAWVVTSVVMSNYNATTCRMDISLNGTSIMGGNVLAGEVVVMDIKQVLEAGKNLNATASVNNTVGLAISGVEVDA